MINMISFASLDKIEKQKNPAESADAQSNPESFAALLSVPVELPNNFVNKSAASSEKTFSETTIVNGGKTDSQIALPQQKNAVEISPMQNTGSADFAAEAQNQIDSNGEHNFVKTDTGTFPDKGEALIKAGIASGKVEILGGSGNIQARNFLQNDFSEKAAASAGEKGEISKNLFGFLTEISNLFKNENSVEPKRIEAVSDFSLEAKVSSSVAPNKLSASLGESETTFGQPETGMPKAAKQLKPLGNISVVGFDEVLSSVPKELKTADVSAQTPANTGEILEQVEPQMLQLLALNNVEDAKKTIKMRLHPAELGTIEIKLEKNASGKLVAHFQTENEATKQILTESLDQLRDSLQKSGWQIERLEIACRPFSSNGQADRENQPRQFETVENRLTTKIASDETVAPTVDLKSNRLLSVRA